MELDLSEPSRVAEAVVQMGLRYVVITSVTRDDLEDGGASGFVETVRAIRSRQPDVRIEVLVPDFGGCKAAIQAVAQAGVDVFNHNIETVPRLFPAVRPIADYRRSLEVLRFFGSTAPSIPTKSGLMLGMGETDDDLLGSLNDLREVGVSILTLGQYLAPSSNHWPVERYVSPEQFQHLKEVALTLGFSSVASGPLVRSSFHADLLATQGQGLS